MARLEGVLILAEMYKVDSASMRVFDLACALDARGIEAATISSVGQIMADKFRRAGLPLRHYYRLNRLTLPYLFNSKIIKIAQNLAPDVIHASSPRLSALAARIARACRSRYVVTVNNIDETRYRIARSRRCAGVIAVSQFVREWLVNRCDVPKECITVIPHGINVDLFCGAASTLQTGGKDAGEKASAPVIGMIGNHASREAHDLFVQAAVLIAERLPNSQFVVADDVIPAYLRDRLAKHGLLKRTTFTSVYLDFRCLLQSFDLLLMPSTTEGHARLLLEAMACRRPVIATGAGENYEIIRDGENGLLVQKNDPKALADRAVEILADHDLRRRIIDAGAESVRDEFSLARMTTDTLSFYAHAMTI